MLHVTAVPPCKRYISRTDTSIPTSQAPSPSLLFQVWKAPKPAVIMMALQQHVLADHDVQAAGMARRQASFIVVLDSQT